MLLWWWLSRQGKQQHHNPQATSGQVNPETPAPGDLCRKEATEQRSANGCEAKCRAEETHAFRPFLQRQQVDEDDHCPGEGTGTTDARNSTSNYKCGRGRAAAQTTEPTSKITMSIMKVHLEEKKVCCARVIMSKGSKEREGGVHRFCPLAVGRWKR